MVISPLAILSKYLNTPFLSVMKVPFSQGVNIHPSFADLYCILNCLLTFELVAPLIRLPYIIQKDQYILADSTHTRTD